MSRERTFGNHQFGLAGEVEPERTPDGSTASFMPQDRLAAAATSRLHAYGAGPFCRFRIGRNVHQAGLYVLTVNEAPVYAGECVNLSKRWGPNGYGGISPRNCYDGGQPTNCRINNKILVEARNGASLALWFLLFEGSTDARRRAETELIQALRPPWNKAKLR